jgi:hypothetical protein
MDCCVVGTNVVLTLVVSKVFLPWVVFDVKFLLCHSICNPKKSCFRQARSLLLGSINYNAYGGRIIAMDWCWWLRGPIFLSMS